MAALAAPLAAHAATSSDPTTTATFAISGGDLTISAQADGGTMDNTTGVAAMGTSDESGVGGVTWDPTLDVALPAQVVAGTYSGTITHSVA